MTVTATLYLRSDYAPAGLLKQETFLSNNEIKTYVSTQARDALQCYFDPLNGGPDKQGWPFERAVYRSEIYQLLDGLPGVDYVEAVVISSQETTRHRADRDATPSAITLAAHELVSLDDATAFTIKITVEGADV